MFGMLLSESIGVIVVLGIAFLLFSQKSIMMKLVGAIFALLALSLALESPTLMAMIGIILTIYVIFVIIRMVLKRRKSAKRCRDCEHDAHAGIRCRNRYCRCDD